MTFHVPNKHRVRVGRLASDDDIGNCGAFFIPNPHRKSMPLTVIASDGDDGLSKHGWEHVSVSYQDRCPTWQEMSHVKSIFWDENDCVVQFHPPKVDYINNHSFCLHMWRSTVSEMPRPPSWMVGFAGLGKLI